MNRSLWVLEASWNKCFELNVCHSTKRHALPLWAMLCYAMLCSNGYHSLSKKLKNQPILKSTKRHNFIHGALSNTSKSTNYDSSNLSLNPLMSSCFTQPFSTPNARRAVAELGRLLTLSRWTVNSSLTSVKDILISSCTSLASLLLLLTYLVLGPVPARSSKQVSK